MTDRYAVVGNPISHSKSPLIHAEFARLTNQDLTYEALLAPPDGFVQTIADFERQGGRGLNVTVPFKEEAYRFADRLSERAREAKAVNTLKREGEGWFGDNTDGAGLVRDLTMNLEFPLAGSRILLMGAGGAARGVLVPLLREHPRSLTLVNRTQAKAEQLRKEALIEFAPLISVAGYDELQGPFDLILNCTSASLQGELPPLKRGPFSQARLVYDMMYGAGITPFCQLARASGAERIAEGIGMLVEQAAETFSLWRGVHPPTRELISRLKSF
ncbi:MAG: shikimate dehydrogenase [Burkholderiales bacterium]